MPVNTGQGGNRLRCKHTDVHHAPTETRSQRRSRRVHVGSCEAAAHRGRMIRRSGDQPRARCVPGLYTHSSLPSGRSHLSRTTLLQAHLGVEKVWRMAVHSRMPVGQERGDSGWSML